jgi:lysozyme
MNIEALAAAAEKKLIAEEGCILTMYQDIDGLWTVGYDWCLERAPMRVSEAIYRLHNDIAEAIAECIRFVPGFQELDLARQTVFVDLIHNMGLHGLLGFRRMMEAVRARDWKLAAIELLDSKYARKLPARAARNARLLEFGDPDAPQDRETGSLSRRI